MTQEAYIDLIYKKLKGTSSPTEAETLQAWLAEKEEHQAIEKSIRTAWELLEDFEPNFEIDTQADYAKLQQRMRLEEKPVAVRRSLPSQWLQIAAAILFLIGAGYVFWSQQSSTLEMMALDVPAGQQELVTLADGTKVWLNENSHLDYPKHFVGKTRAIQLHGEAFLEVTKNPAQPFQITTDQTTVTVLGTAFNVRAYPGEATTEVTVAEGKVRVAQKEAADNAVILEKTERTVFHHQTGQLEKLATSSPNVFAWKSQKLSFKNTPLNEVFKTLEQHYKITINNKSTSLKNCLFTMPPQQISVDRFLENLKAIYKIDLHTSDSKHYIISSGRCD